MNNLATALARFHHPLETDRVLLSHRRANNENGIRVRQRLLRRRCSATSYRGTQTGHRRTVSYSGLVADANHAQSPRKKFLQQIILFVVERRAAKMSDGLGLHQRLAIFRFLKAVFA